MKRIIYNGPEYCAVLENGILVEFIHKEETRQNGDVLLGKIERMMPGIGCAFVDIGRKQSGFLPLNENSSSFLGKELRSGQIVPVQIRKEETGGKGAFLSRDLTFVGKYILFMPMNRHVGVSGRVINEEEKELLRETGRKISDNSFGIVMRASSLNADYDDICCDTRQMAEAWDGILKKINADQKPGCVLYHQDPVSQLISDYSSMGTDEIREADMLPSDLERQLHESKQRMVQTGNGGNIVIDRCEAMTVIDVNTSSYHTDMDKERTFLEMNLNACETISSQIRLRNLSGIILIDFIDMDNDDDRKKVAEKLQEFLENDRRKTVIHGWTSLGILEMTRKRT